MGAEKERFSLAVKLLVMIKIGQLSLSKRYPWKKSHISEICIRLLPFLELFPIFGAIRKQPICAFFQVSNGIYPEIYPSEKDLIKTVAVFTVR